MGGGKLDDSNKLQLYLCVLSFFLFTNTQPFVSIGLIYCVENMTILVLDALQRLAPTSIERMRSRYDKMPILRAYSYRFPSRFIKTAAATYGAFLVLSASFLLSSCSERANAIPYRRRCTRPHRQKAPIKGVARSIPSYWWSCSGSC